MMKEVKLRIVIMMMIWMIRTDEQHALSVTMTWSWHHVIFVLKRFKCKQYFTFFPSILFFHNHFSCKFKGLKHIKELGPTNFKSKPHWAQFVTYWLDCSSLILHNFSPVKFFKFKYLPLVKDYFGEYYPILSDRYLLLVWVVLWQNFL